MSETVSAGQKALQLNLDTTWYGTFAEIGGGQEVARWFFAVGGAAGTVAKTISAYDMLLAARALGLGATLTTRHLLYEKETEAALGLPAGVHSYAIIPIGYPMGHFGPVGRGPLGDIVYEDRWGNAYRGM